MNHDHATATLDPATQTGIDELEVRVQGQLAGRVRDLELKVHDCGIVLRGFARTYHAKQLAQHAVMMETQVPILANEIEVC